jgi:transcriptional regulator with XRE-family HTH domain
MDGSEMRERRKALGIKSQADFARLLGLSRDHVGRMERGDDPILPRTAAAVRSLKPAALDQKAKSRDPIERIVEQALIDAGIRFITDEGGGTESRLDFRLIDFDVEIEVKRFYSIRSTEQIARAPNVILIQGERAAHFFAAAIRSGDLFPVMDAQAVENHRERVEAVDVGGGRFGVFVTRPGPRGRQHILQPDLHDSLEAADSAAREYAKAHPGVRHLRPRISGAVDYGRQQF